MVGTSIMTISFGDEAEDGGLVDGRGLANEEGEGIEAMKPGVGGDPVELEEVELVCW